MDTDVQKKVDTKNKKKGKKHRSAALVILLIVVLILFLLSTIILGSRLYALTTRDQYTLDLELGEPEGEIDLFRIEYSNAKGEITVHGVNADDVVAPGTEMDYDIYLRNRDDVVIDFVMTPAVDFLTDDVVPVEFKLVDSYGNYLLGSETQWAGADEMNALVHKGSIHPGEVFAYHISWQWVFEVSQERDEYDTYLGNQGGQLVPGVRVGINTQAEVNPAPVKSNSHMMHLLGEGFGCCWCCYLVWILLLILLILLIRHWFLHRKINKQRETLEEYEEVLEKHGLLIDGELVDKDEEP